MPDVDAGNGERLVLFAGGFKGDVKNEQLIEEIAKKNKVLISVPSNKIARNWEPLSKPPSSDKFSEAPNAFRKAKNGVFLLVGRYDGIDLPGATCRVMAIDGLPTGPTLLERYQYSYLAMDHFFAGVIANRLVQLFGRSTEEGKTTQYS